MSISVTKMDYSLFFLCFLDDLLFCFFTRHGFFHWKFQLLPFVFCSGFFELRINQVNAFRLSRIVELRFFDSPLLPFPFVELLLTFLTNFSGR